MKQRRKNWELFNVGRLVFSLLAGTDHPSVWGSWKVCGGLRFWDPVGSWVSLAEGQEIGQVTAQDCICFSGKLVIYSAGLFQHHVGTKRRQIQSWHNSTVTREKPKWGPSCGGQGTRQPGEPREDVRSGLPAPRGPLSEQPLFSMILTQWSLKCDDRQIGSQESFNGQLYCFNVATQTKTEIIGSLLDL